MYYIIKREKIRRDIVLKQEKKRRVLKALWQNRKLQFITRYLIFLELMNLAVNGNKVRLKNRCIETGRGKSVLREFHISRIKFRDRLRNGELPGVRKSSW